MTILTVPIGNQQIMQKAVQLAEAALKSEDFGVGFAEGLIDIDGTWYTTVWCAVVSRTHQIGLGGGLLTKLPPYLNHKMTRGNLSAC